MNIDQLFPKSIVLSFPFAFALILDKQYHRPSIHQSTTVTSTRLFWYPDIGSLIQFNIEASYIIANPIQDIRGTRLVFSLHSAPQQYYWLLLHLRQSNTVLPTAESTTGLSTSKI